MDFEQFIDNTHFLTQSEVNKFLWATLLCGIIGAEREFRNKQAGLKTMIMIGLGSTLITILSIKIGVNSHDRIAANIVTGIGFLGAGVIFKDENRVSGLTTACVIWIVSAIGMAVGAGFIEQAIGVTVVALFSLLVFPVVENFFDRRYTMRIYRIVKRYDGEGLDKYEESLKKYKLKIKRGSQQLANGNISGTWTAVGSPKSHNLFVEAMLKDERILELDF